MPVPATLTIEALIARAHRSILTAAMRAEPFSDQGLAEDLHQVGDEIRRLQESLLRQRRPGARLADPRRPPYVSREA